MHVTKKEKSACELQCVAVCGNELLEAMCCSVLQHVAVCVAMSCTLLPCCSVLSWLQKFFLLFSRAPILGAPVYDKEIKEEVCVGCSVLNYAAACCSVLQCAAVCCGACV